MKINGKKTGKMWIDERRQNIGPQRKTCCNGESWRVIHLSKMTHDAYDGECICIYVQGAQKVSLTESND